VSIPFKRRPARRGSHRHILFDFGSTRGKSNEYMAKVCEDIIARTEGDKIAVVLTHGHLDHYKGLYTYFDVLDDKVETFWTTKFLRTAETRRRGLRGGPVFEALDSVASRLKDRLERGEVEQDAEELARERAEADEMLNELCAKMGKRTHYLERGTRIVKPFLLATGAKINVLSPESDGRPYEKILQRISGEEDVEGETEEERERRVGGGRLLKRLKERFENRDEIPLRQLLLAEREYDNATSVVIGIEWEGKHLLFAGDAQDASWEIMHQEGVVKPVDFLKVSHHASHNGTPTKAPEIWKALLGDKEPTFLVSTYDCPDWRIPNPKLLKELKAHGELVTTQHVKGNPGYLDLTIDPA
jgi:hypothetical protein